MKKFLGFIFTIIFVFSLTIVLGNACSSFQSELSPNGSHKISFILNGKVVMVQTVDNGGRAMPPNGTDLKDGAFLVWLYNGAEYDFSAPVTGEVVLTAVASKNFTVTFTADGKTVGQVQYNYFNRENVRPPEVPKKQGYTCEWEEFSLDGGDKTVAAEYKPIKFTVEYFVGETLIYTAVRTIEDYESGQPPVPERQGYDGKWVYSFNGENSVTATAEYELKTYNVNFFVNGTLYHTVTAVWGDADFYPPIPKKEHYSARWEQAVFGDKTEVFINAVYEPKIYTARFEAAGQVFEIPFTINDKAVLPPPVPDVPHYSGEWEDYNFEYADFTVNAAYTPVIYKINFMADGSLADTIYYTVESDLSKLTLPQVPKKNGYAAEWDKFEANGGDLEVNAIYTPLAGTDGLAYSRRGEGYAVSGYNGGQTSVVVPSFHNGLPVTEIANAAFLNGKIEEITICENVKLIDVNAFNGCANLKRVGLPDGLSKIGQAAFSGCVRLEEIEVPASVKEICMQAFLRCGLKKLILKDGLEIIGEQAFYLCTELEEADLPNSVKEIESMCFTGCGKLKCVKFGSGMKKIGSLAFYYCGALTQAYFADAAGWVSSPLNEQIDLTAVIASSPENAALALRDYYNCAFIKNGD